MNSVTQLWFFMIHKTMLKVKYVQVHLQLEKIQFQDHCEQVDVPLHKIILIYLINI